MLQIKANEATADVQSISYDPGVGLYVTSTCLTLKLVTCHMAESPLLL